MFMTIVVLFVVWVIFWLSVILGLILGAILSDVFDVKYGFEVAIEDLWVGVFWRSLPVSGLDKTQRRMAIWVCIIPVILFHISWRYVDYDYTD